MIEEWFSHFKRIKKSKKDSYSVTWKNHLKLKSDYPWTKFHWHRATCTTATSVPYSTATSIRATPVPYPTATSIKLTSVPLPLVSLAIFVVLQGLSVHSHHVVPKAENTHLLTPTQLFFRSTHLCPLRQCHRRRRTEAQTEDPEAGKGKLLKNKQTNT